MTAGCGGLGGHGGLGGGEFSFLAFSLCKAENKLLCGGFSWYIFILKDLVDTIVIF